MEQDPQPTNSEKIESSPVDLNRRAAEEDAARLELGPEFHQENGAQPLFLSEVAHLLNFHGKKKDEYEPELNPVLDKSLKYARRFGQLQKPEQAIAIRDQLMKIEPKLHPFEIAQLASLMPGDANEAKAIVPSLVGRYDDDVLNEMVKNMNAWL